MRESTIERIKATASRIDFGQEIRFVKTGTKNQGKLSWSPLSAELDRNAVKLIMPCVDNHEKLVQMESFLSRTAGLKLLIVGGNDGGEANIVLVVDKPDSLLGILTSIPCVLTAVPEGEDIIVTLK